MAQGNDRCLFENRMKYLNTLGAKRSPLSVQECGTYGNHCGSEGSKKGTKKTEAKTAIKQEA